jgi:hypothetical protein
MPPSTSMSGPILRSRIPVRPAAYVALALLVTWALYATLAGGRAPRAPAPRPRPLFGTGAMFDAQDEWPARADAVRAAFVHAYRGWETRAAPRDELLPVSGKGVDKLCSFVCNGDRPLSAHTPASMAGASRSSTRSTRWSSCAWTASLRARCRS